MKNIFKPILSALLFQIFCITIFSQNNFFSDAGVNTVIPSNGKREVFPDKYRASVLNFQQMKDFLWTLPL